MTRPATPQPQDGHPHDHHDPHPHQHGEDCDEHHERCHVNITGYMDCPKSDCHFKTTMLTVTCGADDPKNQIQAYLNQAGNGYDEVLQVVDLGHNGWLVLFKHPV